MAKKFLYVGTDGLPVESPGAFESSEFLDASAGAGDAGKPVILDAGGKIDATMIEDGDIDHGAIAGLGDDDHTQYILVDGTRAFTGDQAMGGFKITGMADGTAAADAVNKSQLDSVAAGFDQKEAVRLSSNAALAANTAAGSGVGKTLTADANGILSIDGVVTVANDRVLIKDEAAADIDNGVYVVTQVGTAALPFILTRAADFDGNPSGEVSQGASVFVREGTINSFTGWYLLTADPITVDTTALQFDQFQGLPQYTASLGVELVGADFRADLLAAGGIKVVGNELSVEPNDFAGEGMVDDGADNLAIDWSTAFNDSKAIKASDLSSVANSLGASIIGIEDANSSFTSANVEGALDELFGLIGQPGVDYTVGAGGVVIGNLCYISGNDTVLPYNTLSASHRGIGLALTTESAASTVKVAANDSVIAGALAGATAGTPYYWNGSALVATIPSGSGSFVWQAGVAKNATDLAVEVRFIKKNA